MLQVLFNMLEVHNMTIDNKIYVFSALEEVLWLKAVF